MFKITYMTAFIGLVAIASLNAQAQSASLVDPGVSTHNYKHPNKAAQAKNSAKEVRVPTIGTIERYGKMRGTNKGSSTPKYATRPATLVIQKTYETEKVQINPQLSSRNYKANSHSSRSNNTEIAVQAVPGDSIYPNQD